MENKKSKTCAFHYYSMAFVSYQGKRERERGGGVVNFTDKKNEDRSKKWSLS